MDVNKLNVVNDLDSENEQAIVAMNRMSLMKKDEDAIDNENFVDVEDSEEDLENKSNKTDLELENVREKASVSDSTSEDTDASAEVTEKMNAADKESLEAVERADYKAINVMAKDILKNIKIKDDKARSIFTLRSVHGNPPPHP